MILNLLLEKRKTLLNALTNSNIFKNKEEGVKILKKAGIEENIRAEKLTIQQFANISNEIL